MCDDEHKLYNDLYTALDQSIKSEIKHKFFSTESVQAELSDLQNTIGYIEKIRKHNEEHKTDII